MRKTQWRPVRTKNGDAQIVHLHRHVSHYQSNLIWLPTGTTVALIGHTLGATRIPLQSNPRHALWAHIADLTAGWGHCDTNRRHTMFDACLLFDALYGHPGCWLHPEASQDLAVALYLHKQHTETQNVQKHIAKLSIFIKPINYIYQSNVTQIVSFRPQSLSINYYAKSHCHLTKKPMSN
jgi:hypothetical protein